MKSSPLPQLSRRDFVKTATAAGHVRRLAGIIKAQQAPSMNVFGANNRINVACVGFSDRFQNTLLPSFLKSKGELNFEMVALADLWSVRRDEGKGRLEKDLAHSIDIYRSDEELYKKAKNVDAVIITTASWQAAGWVITPLFHTARHVG